VCDTGLCEIGYTIGYRVDAGVRSEQDRAKLITGFKDEVWRVALSDQLGRHGSGSSAHFEDAHAFVDLTVVDHLSREVRR